MSPPDQVHEVSWYEAQNGDNGQQQGELGIGPGEHRPKPSCNWFASNSHLRKRDTMPIVDLQLHYATTDPVS